MKIKTILMAFAISLLTLACQVSDFEDNYTDPSRISQTSVEKQYTGFMIANRTYVLPSYWNYFVVLRITLNRYNQAVGWENVENQYVPGSAAITDRWNNYYSFLAQYRELEKVYNALSSQEQQDYRVFMITAATYLYDHTQKIVDLHGDIPWSKAGMLSTNGGQYAISYPEYDTAESIYTKMLDDLAVFADELRGLDIPAGVQVGFNTQDLINRGDKEQWLRYINSLRLRMLTRVRAVPQFSQRANTEIAAILANPSAYPLVTSNEDNITFRIHTLGTLIGSSDFQSGLEDWDGNLAGKAILDHMKTNQDPRLSYVFEPGEEAGGEYIGLDPLASASVQRELIGSGTLARYNRSTLSRNQYFPGMLINATQVHLMIAEHYLTNGQMTNAKEHYETAIRESVAYYQMLRSLSNDNTAGNPIVPSAQDIENYLSQPAVSWDSANGGAGLIQRIAEQKWLHFNVVQANENWAELRRLDALDLNFWVDNSNQQSLPPKRWIYPGTEETYNTENYARVQDIDNLETRLFWDVN
ncbi:MAG TPA: SusD/RagB family nutrient-binding outer membrane lipoprotein [Cyclobacteriaceae bacterium]|nr:SusD/RagB family nutrient-binding outer membrane lipoprotein [Cyclobacteriaceae bacterium]